MKIPDPVKERGEKKLSLDEFYSFYNEDLPSSFPSATKPFLKAFKKDYPALFKDDDMWSLDQHRKKFMDWLPQHIRSVSQ